MILKLKNKKFITYLSTLNNNTLLSKIITTKNLNNNQLPNKYKKLKKKFKLNPITNENNTNNTLLSFTKTINKKKL